MQQISGDAATFAIETHGCKLNQADTLVLAREFAQAGLKQVSEDEPADVYVVNSCTVTHVADKKARHSLRAARRRNPQATIIATGCYAERSPEQLRAMDEIDLVFGNVDKTRLVQQVLDWRGSPSTPCAIGDDAEYVNPRVSRTRAMVKIQEGCNQICAYCIVPKVRGRERSVPTAKLISEVQSLIELGYKEVVLTGTQLGSYGFDLSGSSLPYLIESILSHTDIQRLRVSSLQPKEVTDDLLRLWCDGRLCPHFHLPLQSGSDRILGSMRRRYTAEEYIETIERIRISIPHASVTSDVIVGFPGEEEEDFQATYELCERVGFSDLHVFPYSIRPGTSAAYFDNQVSPTTKSQRMQALLSLAKSQARQFRQDSLGMTRAVLWESLVDIEGNAFWTGLTDNYIRVRTYCKRPLQNVITLATLTDVCGDGVTRAEVH